MNEITKRQNSKVNFIMYDSIFFPRHSFTLIHRQTN